MKRASAERLAAAYTLPAPRRAPHPVPRRPADPRAADARRRPGLDRRQPGLSTRRGAVRAARPARRDARVRRRPSSTRCCTTAGGTAEPATAAAAAARRRSRSTARPSSSSCRPSWRRACGRWCEQPKIRMLRDDSKLRLAAPGGARRQAVARGALHAGRRRCRFVDWLEPLLRRESYLALLVERPEVQNRLLRLLGLARWPMRYLMLHPGVIDELADERLLHGRFDAAAYTRELEERHAGWERSGQADEELAARHPAPRPPRRGVPHAGARRRGPHHRRAGGRRPVGAGRCDARLRAALGLAAPEAAHRDEPQLAVDRLRQARRQGARLRQRPRRRVRLRRSRDRRRQGGRGLRRLRAQADQLADDAHRRRRAVRHRHRAAAERQLGPAGHLDRRVRELPDRPRQQHRLDLGAPGADAGALVRRARTARAALRGGAAHRAGRAARRAALRAEVAGDAREGARGASGARPAASTSSTAPAA